MAPERELYLYIMKFTRKQIQEINRHSTLLKIGKIVQVYPNTHTYDVQTTGGGFIHATNSMQGGNSFMRGSGEANILDMFTQVVYYQNANTGFIVGCIPEPGVPSTHVSPITFSQVTSDSETSSSGSPDLSYRNGPPDLLPGDWVRYNSEGGFIGLLRGAIATLGTGPRSSIEFFSIDDVGKLNARNLFIDTDFMELESNNDEGEVNLQVFGAPNYFETLGSNAVGEELGTHSEEEGKLRYRAEPYDRMGKWRIHAFAGWLGDNLHLFISQRGDANRRTDEKTSKGLTEVMLSRDGAVRVRSCRELMLEKVARIHVPKKIREAYHNVKGDTKKDGYEPTEHEFYEWDDANKEGRRMQATEYHSHEVDHEEIRHFRDHKKDWNIESERTAKMPVPPSDIFEGSKTDEFENTYSLIHQRSDGSIYFEDTWGSIIDMNNEDISITAKRDLRMQAGRDFIVSGAREGAVRAHKDLNVVSHDGNLRVKAHEDLRLYAEQNSSLDSGAGNTAVISRKKDVLIRSEREKVIVKADLGNIQLVSVNEGIDLRSTKNIQILSDKGFVGIHGQTKVQVTCPTEIIVAVGPEGPSSSMKATKRDSNGLTNTTNSIDSGNISGIKPLHTYLNLTSSESKLSSIGTIDITSSISVKSNSPGASLELLSSTGALTSTGELDIIKNNNEQLNDRDSGNDNIWTEGGPHREIATTVDPTTDQIISVKADVRKDEYADGRFRYNYDGVRTDHIVHQYPWQNMDPEKGTPGLKPWKDLINISKQDVPDLGTDRPVSGDQQTAQTTADKDEHVLPYGKYKKYKYGKFPWESRVVPGKFEETDEFLVPKDTTSSTTTVVDSFSSTVDGVAVGRVNLIPSSAEGKSFKGDLEREKTEDPINEIREV